MWRGFHKSTTIEHRGKHLVARRNVKGTMIGIVLHIKSDSFQTIYINHVQK